MHGSRFRAIFCGVGCMFQGLRHGERKKHTREMKSLSQQVSSCSAGDPRIRGRRTRHQTLAICDLRLAAGLALIFPITCRSGSSFGM